jgi:hypothetical protein
MKPMSLLLVGGPDSGKTNYVGRLWASLQRKTGRLRAVGMPTNIEYVDNVVEHLMKGKFASRTDRNLGRMDFSFGVQIDDGPTTNLVVPDITGELWQNAIHDSEIPKNWLDELKAASAALLFVRVHSKLNVQPPDWVTAKQLLTMHGREPEQKPEQESKLPTQMVLCELLRHLNSLLSDRPNGDRPRVAIIVSAWDRLDAERQGSGPMEFLRREFPLVFGRLRDTDRLDIRVFGMSILDGDLNDDEEFREASRGKDISTMGSVVVIDESGAPRVDRDITLPVAWLAGD